MNNGARHNRTGLMQRLRRGSLVVALVLALLVPARPAHAILGIDDAVINYIGAALTPGSWAQSIASSVIISIRAYLHVLMESVRAKGEYDRARAIEDFRNEVTRRSLQARLQVENMPSPNRNSCLASTANRREQESAAEAEFNAQDLLRRDIEFMASLSRPNTSGGGPSGGPGGGPGGGDTPGPGTPGGVDTDPEASSRDEITGVPTGNPTASAITLSAHSCRYRPPTERNIQDCARLGVAAEDVGIYEGLDASASALLDPYSFDNRAHRQAAIDNCRNIVMNKAMDISSGASAMVNSDAVKANRKSYSQLATAAQSQMICNEVITVRTPERDNWDFNASADNVYNKMYRRFMHPLGFRPLDANPDAEGQQWPPLIEEDSEERASSYTPLGKYTPGRPPSALQRKLFRVAQLNDERTTQASATSTHEAMRHTIIAKAVTISQNYDRLRMLERQLLMEAAGLAREAQGRR